MLPRHLIIALVCMLAPVLLCERTLGGGQGTAPCCSHLQSEALEPSCFRYLANGADESSLFLEVRYAEH